MKTIMGLETEYGIMTEGSLAGSYERHLDEIEAALPKGSVCIVNAMPKRSSSIRDPVVFYKFLPSGGLIYLDRGAQIEHCTPECTSPVDVVRYEKAGELEVMDLLPHFEVIKNNMADDILAQPAERVHYGCHENYYSPEIACMAFSLNDHIFDTLMRPDKYIECEKSGKAAILFNSIVSFLATRQIYTGAGSVFAGRYHLSQKGVREGKNFLKIKEKRLSIECGDSNMSQMAIFMKTAVTEVLLEMIRLEDYPEIVLEDPVETFNSISSDVKMERPLNPLLPKGTKLKPIEIQRIFLDRAKNVMERHRHLRKDGQYAETLERWGYILNTLEKDPRKLSNWCDVWLKYRLFEDYGQDLVNEGKAPDIEAVGLIDLEYHKLRNGLFRKAQSLGLVETLVTQDDIMETRKRPPQGTRAFYRGMAARKGIIQFSREDVEGKDVAHYWTYDWDQIGVKISDCTNVDLSDPYDPKKGLARQHGLLD